MDDQTGSEALGADDANLQRLAANLRGLMEQAGIEPPDQLALTASYLNVGGERSATPPQVLAEKTADLLRGKNLLFRRAHELGTIDPSSGQWEVMTPHRFCTWLPGTGMITPISGFWPKTGLPIVAGLGVENARLILASDEMRVLMPVVERINRVRLPVFRALVQSDAKPEKDWTLEELEAMTLEERRRIARRGFRKLELLPLGYDGPTKTFTASAFQFDSDLDPNEALKWLLLLVRDFQWGDPVRSRSVFVQAFLTLFCRGLYLGKSPMFLFNSNLVGSGKSRLAELCIKPVVGSENTAPSGWNRDDRQETRKELDAFAQAFSPYIWFDDLDRCRVASTDLNRWLTAKTWSCRVMGGKETFRGPLFAATFMTGLCVTTDDNLERRTLWVDLFARQASNEREIKTDRIELDDDYFENTANMQHCCAVCWALIRWWDENDRPMTKQRPVESFESWSRIVASIAECAGFKDGLKRYESPDSGNQEGREWKMLTTALIREHCIKPQSSSAVVTMRDVVRCARLEGLLVDKLWTLRQVQDELAQLHKSKKFDWPDVEEKFEEGSTWRSPNDEEKRLIAAEWTNRSMDSGFGKAFKKAAVAGQWFYGADGKVYEFGKRGEGKLESQFVIRMIGSPSQPTDVVT